MWEMTYIFANWLKCLRNGQNIWEMTLICWEMAQICDEMTYLFNKLLKNVNNDLEIWEMAKIFGKWLRCMGHGLSI